MRPRLSLVVCAVPRCGSSLISSLLASAGAGHPGEYFWRDEMAIYRERWQVSSPSEYVKGVLRAGTSSNGVFAMKLMWEYLNELFVYLRGFTGDYDRRDRDVLRQVFTNPHFVWMRRADVVGQAVSWWKAIQSGQWWAAQERKTEPVYDFEQIDWLVNQIHVFEGCWRRWFDAEGIDPIVVDYADLCANQTAVTLAVLDTVGFKPSTRTRIAPHDGLVRQGDEMNAQWVSRYIQDKQEASKASVAFCGVRLSCPLPLRFVTWIFEGVSALLARLRFLLDRVSSPR